MFLSINKGLVTVNEHLWCCGRFNGAINFPE